MKKLFKVGITLSWLFPLCDYDVSVKMADNSGAVCLYWFLWVLQAPAGSEACRQQGLSFKDPDPRQQAEVLTGLIRADLWACWRRCSQQRRQLKLERSGVVWGQLLWGGSACRGSSSSRLLQLRLPLTERRNEHQNRIVCITACAHVYIVSI